MKDQWRSSVLKSQGSQTFSQKAKKKKNNNKKKTKKKTRQQRLKYAR